MYYQKYMTSTTKVVKHKPWDNLIWDNLEPSRQNQKLISTASEESFLLNSCVTLYENKRLENRVKRRKLPKNRELKFKISLF